MKVEATRKHTALEAGGWRTSEVEYTFGQYGRRVETNDHGDTSIASDDLCTTTDYVTNTSAWILNAVRRVETVSVDCGTSPSRPDDVVSDERYRYDGQAYGDAPTKGHVTMTRVLDDWAGGPVYVTTSEADYDAHGRMISSTDALDRETTLTYTPTTGGPVTQVVTRNPAGHTTTSRTGLSNAKYCRRSMAPGGSPWSG